MKMLEALGSAARDARREAGIRPGTLAHTLDRDSGNISRFERGQAQPRNLDAFVEEYAKAVGTTAHKLWADAFDRYMGSMNGNSHEL